MHVGNMHSSDICSSEHLSEGEHGGPEDLK
jgi:hypothetical protein